MKTHKCILDDIKRKGYSYAGMIISEQTIDDIKKLSIDKLKSSIKTQQSAGYSASIDQKGFTKLTEEVKRWTDDFINTIRKEKFMYLPRHMDTTYMLSLHDSNNSEPTRAYLWHRDLEDYFYPMIKIMIPLTETSEENGGLSVASKRVCPYKSKIIETSEDFVNSRFDKNDKNNRITVKTMRKNFSSDIYDFYVKPGHALIFDSQECYHKGGQVLKPDLYRLNIQITIGTPFNVYLIKYRAIRYVLNHVIFRIIMKIASKKRYSNYKQIASRKKNIIPIN